MGFHDVLFQSLEDRGWAISDRIVPSTLAQALHNHAHQLWQQGFFKPASIGRQAGLVHDADIRGDAICWLDEKSPAPPSTLFLDWAASLRQALNRHFFLSLRTQEFHFARYEPGRGYARHIDQHQGTGARKVSLVLYLNEDWQPEDGGELCLFDSNGDGSSLSSTAEPVARILPQAGRLVLFQSDRIPHQVLPARRVRWSLTGWYRDDA